MLQTVIEKDAAKKRLDQYLATLHIKIAHTVEELYANSVEDNNGEEVDDFIRQIREWRDEDDSHQEIS